MKILVSACLLGEPVRYDGKENTSKLQPEHWRQLKEWSDSGMIIPVCPEMLGGLPTPRPAAEIALGTGKEVLSGKSEIITRDGELVTQQFLAGAQKVYEVAKQHNAQFALLAARSPSCGNQQIYDGTFQGTLKVGMGVTAQLLTNNAIRCFNPNEFEILISEVLKRGGLKAD